MRKVLVTETPWGVDVEALLTQVAQLGAAEIIHVDGGYPAWLTAAGVSTPGYHEVAEPGDPPTDLAAAQALQLKALTTRKLAELSTMAYQGYTVTLTAQDQIDIMGAVQQLTSAPAGTTLQWEIVDGVFLTIGQADIQALYAAGITHIQDCYVNAGDLTAQIMAAPTADAALAVDISQGWPS
jgi:hypothetical protein